MMKLKIASTKDLSPGKTIGITSNGKEILIASLGGKYYAIGNVCTHRGCKLSNGTLIEEKIECPCHGSVFDVKTGKVLKGPAKKSEPVFEVKVKEGQIFVNV